jgi:hypothetical protein
MKAAAAADPSSALSRALVAVGEMLVSRAERELRDSVSGLPKVLKLGS